MGFLISALLKKYIIKQTAKISRMLLESRREDMENFSFNVIKRNLKYPWSLKYYGKLKITSLEDMLNLPVQKLPPSNVEYPLYVKPFIVRASTTGTKKRKIVLYTPYDLHLFVGIFSTFVVFAGYRIFEDSVSFVSAGYAPDNIMYGSTAIAKTFEKILPKKLFYHSPWYDINSLIKKIKGKELDILVVFAPFLNDNKKILEFIKPKDRISIVWTGDIINQGDINDLLEILDKRGFREVLISNIYACVENPILGAQGPMKITSGYITKDKIEELKKIHLLSLFNIPIFKDLSNSKFYLLRNLENIVAKNKEFMLYLSTANSLPLLKYELGDIIRFLGFDSRGFPIVKIIGRYMFEWRGGYKTGSSLRIMGHTIKTDELVNLLDSLGEKLYLAIFEKKEGKVTLKIYVKKAFPLNSLLRKISEPSYKYALWGINNLYKVGILDIRIESGEKGKELWEYFKKKYPTQKIPKVLYKE